MGLGTSRLRLSCDARLSLGFPSVGSLHSFLEYSLPYSLLGNNSNLQRWNRTIFATASTGDAVRTGAFDFCAPSPSPDRRSLTNRFKEMHGAPTSCSRRSVLNGKRDRLRGASPRVTESS